MNIENTVDGQTNPTTIENLWVSMGFGCRNSFSLVVKSENILLRSSDQEEYISAHNFRSSYFSTLSSTHLFDCCHRKVFRVETRFSNICLFCVLDIFYSPLRSYMPLFLVTEFISLNSFVYLQQSSLPKFYQINSRRSLTGRAAIRVAVFIALLLTCSHLSRFVIKRV